MIRVHIFVTGRVQGVLFRDRTRRKADSLGVFGWVKNVENGMVEIVAEGEKEKIYSFINWVKKVPFPARVDGIEVKLEEYKNEFNKFKIIYG